MDADLTRGESASDVGVEVLASRRRPNEALICAHNGNARVGVGPPACEGKEDSVGHSVCGSSVERRSQGMHGQREALGE